MFKKVVFTGGACGGKSSIIKALKNKIDCVISPEPAWIVFGLQQKLNIKMESEERQHLIFNLHVLFEYWAEENVRENEIILMDRSLIDNSVFTQTKQFEFLISRYHIDYNKIFRNYSAIIYCQSIAHTNSDEFMKLRPFADIHKVKELDLNLLKAYKSSKNIFRLDANSLQERIDESLTILTNLNNTRMNMHKLIPIQYIELLLYDTRNIMNRYLIAKDIQNCILNPVLKNQDYYIDNFNKL